MAIDSKLLAQFIDESGLRFKKNAVSYIFNCPRCEKKDKLFIRQRDGRFVCWYCKEIDGYQGRGEYALADLTQLPLAAIRPKLGLDDSAPVRSTKFLNLQLKWPYGDDEDDEADDDMGGGLLPMQWPLDYYPIDDPKAKRGAEYLAARGIPMDIAKQYRLRYAPTDRRVVFPAERHGQLYGWQARLVIAHEWWDENRQCMRSVPKILSSRSPDQMGWRERCLMFWDRLDGVDHAVLCEGPVDALKAHLCGGNVATMGKAISRSQLLLLRAQGTKKLYLALDPDAAAETSRLIRDVGADMEVYLMQPPPDRDLGAMAFEEVYELYKNARRPQKGEILYFLRPLNG